MQGDQARRRSPRCTAPRGAAPRGVARRADASCAETPKPPAGGFSLLEVLVAFVILSLVATALFRLFSGALGNASAADEYSRAVLVAESVLAEAAAAQPLRESSAQGSTDDGRLTWKTSVARHDPADVNPDLASASESMATQLYRVTAEVTFPAPAGGSRTVALATTRIGARESR
jgi:general secretion pathway protein I